MARKFVLLSFTVLVIKLKYKDSKRCVYDNYLRDDKKKRTTDHHVKEMVDSMSQKKRRGV